MQTIYKLLVPRFLQRWDARLLESFPVVWRTRAHFVLLYALIAAVVLFILGFFYPISATKLTVDPIQPIILNSENLYFFPLAALSIGILYWAYSQFQSGFLSTKSTHVLLTLLIYSFCLYFIISITASAFYFGTIFRTATFLINEKDIEYWEENNYFVYGSILRETDSLRVDDYAAFKEGEVIFQAAWSEEEHNLERRYDSLVSDESDNASSSVPLYRSDRLYRRDILRRLNFSFKLDTFDLSNQLYELYRLDLMDTFQISVRLALLDQSYLVKQLSLLGLSNVADDLKRFNQLSNMPDHLGLSYKSYLSNYWNYYKHSTCIKIDTSIIEKYKIPLHNDSVRIDSFVFVKPAYIYDMENAVRSVHHAQQYLKEGIFFRHFYILLYYIPLLAILLFTIPYLSFRSTIVLIMIGGAAGVGAIGLVGLAKPLIDKGYYLNVSAYLALPLTGVLLLTIATLRRTYEDYVPFAFHMLAVGIASVLFFAMFGEKWIFTNKGIYMGKPVDIAFFGIQIIGMVGVLLMAYLQALPKRV